MIKILHDNITSFRNTLYEDKRQMVDEIDKLNANLEDLKTIWLGKDSDAFCNNNILLYYKFQLYYYRYSDA